MNSKMNLAVLNCNNRPETLLGDSAVAVNPNDKRFKHHIGKEVKVPIINKYVKIIGDEYVDKDLELAV